MTRVTRERATRRDEGRETVTYPRVPRPGEATTCLVEMRLVLTSESRARIELHDDGGAFIQVTDLYLGGRHLDVSALVGPDGRPRRDHHGFNAAVTDDRWGAAPVSAYHRDLALRRLPSVLAEARSRLTAAWLSHPYEPPPATAVTP